MTVEERLGTVRREGDAWVVQFERRLAHPPATVWSALTESEHLARWMPCDLVGERREGAELRMPFWPAMVERHGLHDLPEPTGRLLVWRPPETLEYTWGGDRLRFDLRGTAGGTLLRLTVHTGADGAAPDRNAAGYHACLDNLEQLLDGGDVPELADVDVTPLEDAYRAVVAAP